MWIEWDGDLVNLDLIVAITMITDPTDGREAVTLFGGPQASFTRFFKKPGDGKFELEKLKIMLANDQLFPGAFLES